MKIGSSLWWAGNNSRAGEREKELTVSLKVKYSGFGFRLEKVRGVNEFSSTPLLV